MTLASDITATLPFLRAEAEGRMVDACIITRGGGAPTFDPNTGNYMTPAGSTIYSGSCEVQISDGLNAREAQAGGTELSLSRLTLKVPVSAVGIRVDDVAVITTATHDPDLEDRTYRVIGEHSKTFATARRLQVEEVA